MCVGCTTFCAIVSIVTGISHNNKGFHSRGGVVLGIHERVASSKLS